jgi:CRP/FNR family transcriptional regulator
MAQPLSSLREAALINALRQCRMFAGLPPGDLRRIADLVVSKALAKGDYLFRENEPVAGFYVVQRGAINVHRVNAVGKEQVIRIFRPGDSLAEAALAGGRGYPADARAESASQVLLVQRTGFIELLRHHADLALRLLASMSQHLREVVSQLDDLTLKDVETRLAHWLLKHCPQPLPAGAVAVQLAHTKRVLAAELGTASETLSRTLAKLKELGLLKVDGSRITILDPPGLRQLLQRHLGE